jgi:hypothetical protein
MATATVSVTESCLDICAGFLGVIFLQLDHILQSRIEQNIEDGQIPADAADPGRNFARCRVSPCRRQLKSAVAQFWNPTRKVRQWLTDQGTPQKTICVAGIHDHDARNTCNSIVCHSVGQISDRTPIIRNRITSRGIVGQSTLVDQQVLANGNVLLVPERRVNAITGALGFHHLTLKIPDFEKSMFKKRFFFSRPKEAH